MAKKKYTNKQINKKIINEATNFAKKSPKAFFIIVLILVIVAGLGIGGYFVYKTISKNKGNNNPPVTETDISIEFIYLDTYNTGDCTYKSCNMIFMSVCRYNIFKFIISYPSI